MKLTGESKLLLGILAATGAIIGIAVFFFSKPPAPPKPIARDELVTTDSFSIGNGSASAYLVEFSDFQCPACRAFAPVVNELVGKYPDKLLFVYRHFPLTKHEFAKPAAMAAEAAGEQGKFWEMAKLLFENQDRLSTKPWTSLADELKLDRTAFDAALNSEILKIKVDRDERAAFQLKLPGTPSFFLNGVRLEAASPLDLQKAVEDVVQ
ncbi:MAG: thioredoxin domain-containing protein [Candidatus Gottesmanbacteria bacterium]|nr:thioredoxin domain-containing protein [Candidatus Gottesmanbacteria bacterium]